MKKLLTLLCFLQLHIAYAQDVAPIQAVGGKMQLHNFIEQELIYPAQSFDNGTEGSVIIWFLVNENGGVTASEFRQKVSPACDEEAMRIFKMLEWLPATSIGIPLVDSSLLEIGFNIKKYKRLCKKRGYTTILYPFEPIDSTGQIYFYKNLHVAPSPIFTNEKINLAGFISANLQYPEAALKQNLSGFVKVAFIVESHGKPSNIHIVNSLGAGCNEEAIRIVRLIKWMPGTIDEKAVRTRMTLSINFNLEIAPDGRYSPNVKSSYGG